MSLSAATIRAAHQGTCPPKHEQPRVQSPPDQNGPAVVNGSQWRSPEILRNPHVPKDNDVLRLLTMHVSRFPRPFGQGYL